MGGYGEKLVELHLLKSSELDAPTAKFEGKGNDKVEKPRYEKGKLYINSSQYFEGISPRSLGISNRRLSGLRQMA